MLHRYGCYKELPSNVKKYSFAKLIVQIVVVVFGFLKKFRSRENFSKFVSQFYVLAFIPQKLIFNLSLLDFDKVNNSCETVTYRIKEFESLVLAPPMVNVFPKGRVTWFNSGGNIVHDGDSQDYITADGSLNLIGVSSSTSYSCIVENVIMSGWNCVKSYNIKVGEYTGSYNAW